MGIELPLVSVIIPTFNRKNKLMRLLDSILESDYPKNKLDIIVVDDACTDGTYDYVKKKYSNVKIIRNEKEKLISGSRNVGIRNAKGKYIFFIDDDNIIDKITIEELVSLFENRLGVGIIGPTMYFFKDPNRIWCTGIRRSYLTSLTTILDSNDLNKGEYSEPIESNDFPNAFMVCKEVIKKVGGFNESIFPIHYEEADFGERVRKEGYRIICNPKAKIWHDIPLPEEIKDKSRSHHCDNELRAYYCGRNRVIFHKRYSKWWQFLVFISFFNWVITLYYLKVILFGSEKPFKQRTNIAKSYLKGIVSGLK